MTKTSEDTRSVARLRDLFWLIHGGLTTNGAARVGDAVCLLLCYFFFGVTLTLLEVTAETEEDPTNFTLTVNFLV